MPVITLTRDQAATIDALDALNRAKALLATVADDMTALPADTRIATAADIARFARSAIDTIELAQMHASNERKLADKRAANTA